MTFYHTAEDIRIEDNHVLKARLQTAEGEWNDAEIDLNTCIGNDNGKNNIHPQHGVGIDTDLTRQLPLGWRGLCQLCREHRVRT